MKNIKFITKSILALALVFTATSCDRDDQIGDSVWNPSTPSLSINLDFGSPTLIVEGNQEFTFTVALSETNLVDTQLYVKQIGGDADSHDYEMSSHITIGAGSTTGSGVIKILHDEVIEDTETLILQIGDERTANSTMTPVTAQFTILNVTAADLVIDMDWAISETTTDSSGNEIDPTDFADLRLLLTDSEGNILDGADGGSFETYVFDGMNPDGDYMLVADFYAAMAEPIRDLDINLEFNQTGKINHQMHSFGAAINTASICANNFFVMASFTKVGDEYTITEEGINNFESQAFTWANGYDALDAFAPSGYTSHIVSGVDCGGNYLLGINSEWMQTTWGEEIIDEANVYFTIDGAGNITIPSQYIFTTLYSGAEYPYTVSGTGVLDAEAGTLTLNYSLDQEGFDVAGWMFANGYMAQDYYIAEVSL